MPFEQSWLVEGAVIHAYYYDEMTIDEISESIQDTIWRLETSERSLIHIMLDVSDLMSHPTNIGEITKVIRPMLNHERVGWVLLFGDVDPITKFVAQVTTQLFKTRFRILEDKEGALAFLRGIDQTLPELPH